MHSAPSVSFPVGRCAFLHQLYWIGCAVTSACWGYWTLVQPWQGVMGFALVGGVGCAYWGWRQIQWQGHLQWTGSAWCWTTCEQGSSWVVSGVPEVSLDFQTILLLRLSPLSGQKGTPRWLWCQQSSDRPQWQDFRRAVYAAQSSSRSERS